MTALDGIEPDQDSDDYEVEDIAEDDSLVGYRCPLHPYVPVLNRAVLPWWYRDAALLMQSNMSVPVGANVHAGTPAGGNMQPEGSRTGTPSVVCAHRDRYQ